MELSNFIGVFISGIFVGQLAYLRFLQKQFVNKTNELTITMLGISAKHNELVNGNKDLWDVLNTHELKIGGKFGK